MKIVVWGIKGLLSHRQQTAAVPPRTIGHIRPGDRNARRVASGRCAVAGGGAGRVASGPRDPNPQAVRRRILATAVARNAAPAVVAVDVTDSRPQPVPENEAAATLRSEETIAQKQAAAETSGVQERTAPKENAASARTYPSTTSYYGDQIAFEQPKSRRRTSVSLFAAGSVTGGGTVSAGPAPA